MRTEQEMLSLILDFSQKDERIRIVLMNGSRVNPKAPKDIFQDYDVACYVTSLEAFIRNQSVTEYFGETIIVQLPDEMGAGLPETIRSYGYLMQFSDGNRIDLTFRRLDELAADIEADSLTAVFLDKDGLVPELPPPSDRSYLPNPPSEKQFFDCCSEFWWLNPYVAKGLWRGEIIGPKYTLDTLMRGELMNMLDWWIGVRYDCLKSSGKHGRNFPELLPRDFWGMVKNTYCNDDADGIWEALIVMGTLFHLAAETVAQRFGFHYPGEEKAQVSAFIDMIRRLPRGAASFDL